MHTVPQQLHVILGTANLFAKFVWRASDQAEAAVRGGGGRNSQLPKEEAFFPLHELK